MAVAVIVLATAGAALAEKPPKIVSTVPEVGEKNVDPATTEIVVTFDRDMASGFSWTGGGPDYPPITEGQRPHWRDARTAVLPVTLEAGHYYHVGINSKSHKNFRSAEGVPVQPSAVYFTTKGADKKAQAKTEKPAVVKMEPANGARNVDPGTTELRVTFSVPMGGGFSWTGGGPDYPPSAEGKGPYWTEDQLTCVRPVQLQPGRQYRLGLNSPSHKN
ncbi:MAG: Ig-like domain-containing protein, partial [Kiritimatiellae bacterium]|nr:Ig-like domain-containing protein [Kiritimatiellia bacterium]